MKRMTLLTKSIILFIYALLLFIPYAFYKVILI